jgi:hypothetical protein
LVLLIFLVPGGKRNLFVIVVREGKMLKGDLKCRLKEEGITISRGQ